MREEELLIKRLQFLTSSHERLTEKRLEAVRVYEKELARLSDNLRVASALRGEPLPEEGEQEILQSLLQEMIKHPVKGARARELLANVRGLESRLEIVAQEIAAILPRLSS